MRTTPDWLGSSRLPGLQPGARMLYWSRHHEPGTVVRSKDASKALALAVGAQGVVEKVEPGTPAQLCPNHNDRLDDDCLCGGLEGGVIPGRETYAVVTFKATNGRAYDRLAMRPSREGDSWVWACFFCGEGKGLSEEWSKLWSWNGGRPAHRRCMLASTARDLERAGLRPPKRRK